MNDKPNNPPAFPSGDFERMQPTWGMTLRDYFAAHALAGIKIPSDYLTLATTQADVQGLAKELALLAGATADAMLEERKGK